MKNVTVLIVFLFTVLLTRAQHVEIGVKAGMNVAQIKEKENFTDPLLGINIGGLAHIHLSKHIAIQPELVFSMQGGKEVYSFINYKTRLNYINVPVIFQYCGESKTLRLFHQITWRSRSIAEIFTHWIKDSRGPGMWYLRTMVFVRLATPM